MCAQVQHDIILTLQQCSSIVQVYVLQCAAFNYYYSLLFLANMKRQWCIVNPTPQNNKNYAGTLEFLFGKFKIFTMCPNTVSRVLIANCEFFHNSQSKESQEKDYSIIYCPLGNSQPLKSQSRLYSAIRNSLTTQSKPDLRYLEAW